MGEVRVRARVIGALSTDLLRIALGSDGMRTADVPSSTLPPALRRPNAEFVAVVRGRDVVRIDVDGEAWLEVQDLIRPVLNARWDPIGVAGVVDDEYDNYIAPIYLALARGASVSEVADLLASFETDAMGLSRVSRARVEAAATELRALVLPRLT